MLAASFSCLFACSHRRAPRSAAATERPGWGAFFRRHGVKGCFLLYDLSANRWLAYDLARCDQGFLPASSFKVFNSLVGLDSGVLRDEHHLIPWDGRSRGEAVWNRDHTLASALEHSVAWYYQRMARLVGPARMRHYIARLEYGNQDVSAGHDRFWLEGPMRITARQQVDLLVRLYQDRLPFSKRSMKIVRRILVRERSAHHVLRYKTGWTREGTWNLGWLIGWLERDGRPHFFALNVEAEGKGREFSRRFGRSRLEIAREVFRDLKLLPPAGRDEERR